MKAIRDRFEPTREFLGISNKSPICRSISSCHGIVEDDDLITQISEAKIDYALSVCRQSCLVVGQAVCVVGILASLSEVFDQVITECIPSPSGVSVPFHYS
jgi:hypothetical protein